MTDRNEKGQNVRWNVELWRWTNFLKKETEIIRKDFDKKIDAQLWIAEQREQLLVVSIIVTRLTYDNIDCNMLPSKKRMFEKEF